MTQNLQLSRGNEELISSGGNALLGRYLRPKLIYTNFLDRDLTDDDGDVCNRNLYQADRVFRHGFDQGAAFGRQRLRHPIRQKWARIWCQYFAGNTKW